MAYDFVSQFAQKLIQEAGFMNLPPDYLENYSQRLEDQIVRRMGIIAIDNLDDDGLAEYNKILDKSNGDMSKIDQDAIFNLWQDRIPKFSEVMMQGLTEFGEKFLANVKKNK